MLEQTGGAGAERGYVPTWVDLLDVRDGDRVRLVGADASTADEVSRRGGVLDAAEHDLVCVVGARLGAGQVRALAATLVPGGRLVLVVDNALSPLRALDAVTGRPCGHRPAVALARLRRDVRRAGLDVDQVFGLLRSSQVPTTAFDLGVPSAVSSVLVASRSHVGGARGSLIAGLARTSPRLVAALSPAWLLVARAPGGDVRQDELVVGKISNLDSAEVKLLRGVPPRVLERRYLTERVDSEVDALLELERSGFSLSPRVVGDPQPRVSRTTWLHGEPLLVERLEVEDLVAWTGRAARVLDDLHARTRRVDGSVLVHGDFWLGNLLVEGERVVGVVDWTECRRGDDAADRLFLVDSAARLRPDVPGLRQRLDTVCSTLV